MRFLLKKLAAFLRLLGDLFDPPPTALPTPPPILPVSELIPVSVETQRDVGDVKRKMLLLLAKDELTESEQAELNAMTADREVIILEDT